MTFQNYMKPPREKHNVEKWMRDRAIPSLRELQERAMRSRNCAEREGENPAPSKALKAK